MRAANNTRRVLRGFSSCFPGFETLDSSKTASRSVLMMLTDQKKHDKVDTWQVSMMGSLEQVESCHTEGHTLMFGTQRSILGQVGRLVVILMFGPHRQVCFVVSTLS